MDKTLDDGTYRDETELLNKMYTLRAGLSLVMREKSAVDGIVNEAKAKRDDYFSKVKAHLSSVKKNVEAAEAQYRNAQEEERGNLKLAKSRLTFSPLGMLLTFILILTICAVLFCALYWVYSYILLPGLGEIKFFNTIYGWATAPTATQRSSWGFFVMVGASALSVGFVIYAIKWSIAHRCVSDYDADENKEIRTARRSKRNFAAQTAFKRNILVEKKSEYDQLEAQYKVKCDNAVRALSAEVQIKSAPHIARAQALLRALNATYGRILNYRDWANLDLVIYALETSRADTVKEALRFVDDERRMRGIAEAVKGAVKALETTINTQFGRLVEALHSDFGQLSRQIEVQAKIVSSELQAVYKSIENQTNTLDYRMCAQTAATFLVTEAQVQTALYKYSNMSSETLVGKLNDISHGVANIAKSFNSDSFNYRYLTGISSY